MNNNHMKMDMGAHHHHMFSTAPIGVMGEHMHHKGALMISNRFMYMKMNGNLTGTNNFEDTDVYSKYMVTPNTMNMSMNMLSIMYALTNKVTLMVMGNYISNNMNLTTKMGMEFTTNSSGFGDVKINSLIKLLTNNASSLHAMIGTSIPIGSINMKDDTPMMDNSQLAYPMQLGGGTWKPSFGLTYLKQSKTLFFGVQSSYEINIDKNDANYTLGNILYATSWATIKTSDKLNFSTRLAYKNMDKIDGQDNRINPMMMPLGNTKNTGKNQLNLFGGVNFNITENMLKGLKIGIEVGYPIYQNVNGIQMKQHLTATIGVQYLFTKKVKPTQQ